MATPQVPSHYPPNVYARHIKDPIHGHIPISPKLARFIDTMQFQRLRRVKQLGTTSWVWPGGSHTRFEHCLGVAFLARLTVSHLQTNQPELGISPRDIDCVEIAGLCHDLGHGPWSHVWDTLFIPKALDGVEWTHEVASEMMFDALINENNVPITDEDRDFIKALISGNSKRTPNEKAFLFEIVANKRNGLDVDKVDYIHRDSHMVGDPIHLSPVRLINSARVLDNQICYNIKDANQIYELCAARFKLHKITYNHKAAKAIEYMIVDALLSADRHIAIAKRIFDPKQYLFLTDDIMTFIQASEDPELEESRRIFNRISKRELYKCVDYKVIDWPDQKIFRDRITPESIFQSAIALTTQPSTPDEEISPQEFADTQELKESDIIVDFSVMHYGMKEKNPLDFVRFYSKLEINRGLPASQGSYSNLRPVYFAEVLLRVYTKNPEHIEIVQGGYRAILKNLEKEFGLPMAGEVILAEVDHSLTVGTGGWEKKLSREESDKTIATPTETEPPTTPKMGSSKVHSRNASFTMKGGNNNNSSGHHPSTPFAVNDFTTYVKKDSGLGGTPSKKGKGRASRVSATKEATTTVRISVSPSPGGKRRRRVDEHVEDEGKAPKRRK